MLNGSVEVFGQASVPDGAEFRINTDTERGGYFASVDADADGDFVVAWQSSDGIYARRYDASGNALGSDFRVSNATEGLLRDASVGVDSEGGFVVAWDNLRTGNVEASVRARRYDSNGAPLGDEFQVNTYTTGLQIYAALGMAANGDFVTVWHSEGQDGDGDGVFAQRFEAGGKALGSEFQVNTYTSGHQGYASVGMNESGEFVIVWESAVSEGDDPTTSQDGDGIGVYAQRYDASGNAVGSEFQVHTYTTGFQFFPSVAMTAEGTFVIAWQSRGQDGNETDSDGIYARRFDMNGSALGPEFQVNTYTKSDQQVPAVGTAAHGGFVIAWQSRGQDGPTTSGDGIYAQHFDNQGRAVGQEFQVNTYTVGDQSFPSVRLDADGDFVVVWQSRHQEGEASYNVYAQRFSSSPVANADDAPLPTSLALDAIFPNPVRDAATLRYALPTTATVRLTVTDVLGRTVFTRTEGAQPAGEHEARLALNDLPSGVYVVRLDADGATATQRITLVR